MTLEITDTERELLIETLEDRLGSLREQIHHSITSTFTDQLKEKQTLLNGLLEKVKA